MNLKSLLTSLFILVYSFSTAQEINAYSSFSPYSDTTVYCGGRLLHGTLSPYVYYDNNNLDIFSENNQFFLQISSDTNSLEYINIPAYAKSLSLPNAADFLLPDNLEIGKEYRVRMVSTNPVLKGHFVPFVYGAGLLPFTVDFEGSYVAKKNQQAYLSYKLNGIPNIPLNLENFGYYVNKKYEFELSDGSRATSYSML